MQRRFAELRRHVHHQRASAHATSDQRRAEDRGRLGPLHRPDPNRPQREHLHRKRRRISPVPLQRRHLRFERGLLGRIQPVHGDLSVVVDLWQRAGARHLLRTAHDRRRERHHRRQQPRAHGQRDAGADREQLRPRLHPFSTQTSRSSCGSGSNGSGSITNLRIDAAILSIQHSFIVDHYSCGNPLGNLTVNGAIAQRFRGAVGTFSQSTGPVSGYSKRYTYDDRLRYISPPHFLDPVESAWHVQRETVE